MSKICGICGSCLNSEIIKSKLPSMVRLMQHHNWHRVDELFRDNLGYGHISIGAVNEEPQPIYCENKTKSIVFAGKIFDYQSRKSKLQKRGHRFKFLNNDAEFVLHFYEEYGIKRLNELNGIFSFSIWDNQKKELILVNDRYGMRPVFYYHDKINNNFLFASELKSIAESTFYKKKINWDAWNVFLRLGFLVDDDTFFQDIFVLPQACVLRYDLKTVSIHNYWSYNELQPRTKFNEKSDIDHIGFLFKQAIKRRIIPEKKMVVLLSGGLDSSGITAELKSQNVDFNTYTTRKFHHSDKDRKGAEWMAKQLGVKNEFYDLPDDFLKTFEPLKNRLLDYQSPEHAWLLPLLAKIPSQIKVNFDGVGFDTMCDPWIYHDDFAKAFLLLESKKYDEFIRSWYYSSKAWSYLKWPIKDDKSDYLFFSKEIREKFSGEVFIEKIKKQIIKHEGTESRDIFFQLSTRTRRSISLSIHQIIQSRFESFCPYFDNDFFDYIMTLPIKFKKNKKLRSMILKRIHPEMFDKSSSSLNKKNSFIQHHNNYYSQKIKNLSGIACDLLFGFRFDLYNPAYLLPRIIKDLYLGVRYFLSSNKERQLKYFNRCHFGFIPQLYMFHRWVNNNKVKVCE